MSKVSVIGAGFSGLSAASYLAARGHEVHVFEKNSDPGGRARQLVTDNGYVFDMGPSWYWMPDVMESFFADFGRKPSDFYDLRRLDPSFEMILPGFRKMKVPGCYEDMALLFESVEPGSSSSLNKFMEAAQTKYEVAMKDLVYRPWAHYSEILKPELLKTALSLNLFSPFRKYVGNYFSHPDLLTLMEFPVLFLGGNAQNIPSLYSLMNYAGLKLGTWYPIGGFGKLAHAMEQVARNQGVQFHYEAPVERISARNGRVQGITVNQEFLPCDGLVASCDYHHVEEQMLEPRYRNYDEKYWSNKVFAPSCLIFYLGIRKKLVGLQHHTLFFDESFDQHAEAIYTRPGWPDKPLFYACCSSRTDDTVAPPGHENLFLLMPIATGLEDAESTRDHYFQIMMRRLEKHLGTDLINFVDYRKSYSLNNFIVDYNAYKGNAYGLANTLRQTAFFKPALKNKRLKNLVYAGQLTVPGPGVPPAIISGKIAAETLHPTLKQKKNEMAI